MQSNTINQSHKVKSMLAQNRSENTIACLITTIQQEPDNSTAARVLADIIIEQPEHLESAHLVWEQLLAVEPQLTERLLKLGERLLSHGRYLLAQKAFENIQLTSSHPRTVFALIKFWNMVGYPRQARYYLLPIAKKTKRARIYIMIANTFAVEHDTENATLWWVRAFNLLPENLRLQAKPLLNFLGAYREEYGAEIYRQLGISHDDFMNLLDLARCYFDSRLAEFKKMIVTISPLKINGQLYTINFDRMMQDEKIDRQITLFNGLDNSIDFIINFLQHHAESVKMGKPKKNVHLHFSKNLANGGAGNHMIRTLINSNPTESHIIVTCQSNQGINSSHLLEIIAKSEVQIYSAKDFIDNTALFEPFQNSSLGQDSKNILKKHIDLSMVSGCMNAIKHFSPNAVTVWAPHIFINGTLASYLCDVKNVCLHIGSQLSYSYRDKTISGQSNQKINTKFFTMLIADPRFHLEVNTESIWINFQKKFPIQNTSDRVKIKYNPFPEELINSEPALSIKTLRQKLGIPADAKVLGSLSRLDRNKNIRLWLDTAALVAQKTDDLHFVIVGDGIAKEFAIDFATKIGIIHKCHFVGERIKNLKRYYQLMNTVLLTSDSEGLPNTLLEAQALGIPVVARDAGGVKEAVWDKKTGLVIDSDNPNVLAEAVERVLTDKSFYHTVKEHGPRFIRSLSELPAFPIEQADQFFVKLRSG